MGSTVSFAMASLASAGFRLTPPSIFLLLPRFFNANRLGALQSNFFFPLSMSSACLRNILGAQLHNKVNKLLGGKQDGKFEEKQRLLVSLYVNKRECKTISVLIA